MGRNLDPNFHMASGSPALAQAGGGARYQPRVPGGRAWQSVRQTLSTLERLPDDLGRLLRNARRGQVQVGIELAHLKRVGDQIDRSANRLAMALVIAALIIGSLHRHDGEGRAHAVWPASVRLSRVPGAVVCGLWLVRAIWRSSHGRDDD